MLTIGVILLIVGAVIAVATRGRDDAIRLIGVGVALLGAVLILLAVLPSDAHAAAAATLLPLWPRRRRLPQIDVGFARVVAAQVAVGCAPVSKVSASSCGAPAQEWSNYDDGRSRAALAAIGLMLANACKDDPVVMETLSMQLEVDRDANVTNLRRVG